MSHKKTQQKLLQKAKPTEIAMVMAKLRSLNNACVAMVMAKLRSLNNACVCSIDNPCNACLDRVEAYRTLQKLEEIKAKSEEKVND